jgi:cysteine desulfurase
MGEAIAICAQEGAREGARLAAMAHDFVENVARAVDGVQLNGHPTDRIPGNCSLSIEGVEPLALMRRLREVASFSASSACATNTIETSHVLVAMFGETARARQAFRVSPGRLTTQREFSEFEHSLVAAVGDLRRFAA